MKKIAYYITAHGYGHGTRSFDIINALFAADPEVHLVVKTDLPQSLIHSRIQGGNFEVIPGAFDVGLIQKDSIHVDLDASLLAIEDLYSREGEWVALEQDFIRREDIGVVVTDIPAIPLTAAQQEKVPNIAVGNFGWDWIYSDFIEHNPRWHYFSDKFKAVYEQTDLLLRLPFAEPMTAFPNQIDLPLLAKSGTDQRQAIAEKTGADSTKKWVLLSFTTLNLDIHAIEQLGKLEGYEVFTVEPLEWTETRIHCLRRSIASFADILMSMDVVVTKPGFGIVSECIANNRPIIYADRENFLEYDVLVRDIKKYCCNVFIPGDELYTGDLSRALKFAETAPPPPDDIPRGGAEIAARHILGKLT